MEPAKFDRPQKAPVIEINLIGMVRRRWPKILFGTAVGIFLSAMYYVSTAKMYESNVEILVGQRNSEVTNNGTLNSANASGYAIQEDQLATHMRLFISRRLLAEAIDKGNLSELESFRSAAAAGKSGIDHILDHIEVLRGGDGSSRDAMVLRASYRDSSPDDAALILSAVYESYRFYVESHGQSSTVQAVKLMEEARESHEKELTVADEVYREWVKSVPVLIDGDEIKDVHQDRLDSLEIEMNVVSTSLAESRSRLEVIQNYMDRHREEDITNIEHLALLSQKEVQRLKFFLDMTRGEVQSAAFQADQPLRQETAKVQYNRLLQLIQKERVLKSSFGPGHPLVEAVRNEIDITQSFIIRNAPRQPDETTKKLAPAEMLTTYISLLANDIAEMEKRRSILRSESETEMKLAKQIENDVMQCNTLRAKLKRAQARYDDVILRLQELRLSRSYAGFSTDLLERPEASSNAVWPKLPLIGAIGLCVGLLLGCVLAVTSELMDTTFGDVSDLEQTIGAPAIAHVPRFDLRTLRKQSQSGSLVHSSLVTFHASRSAESEIYRVARTALMISNRNQEVRTMMMTSPQPGDGKSTTISNLAISFAQAGKTVLLIDADMRRPVIDALFAIDNELGLSDLLTGSAASSDVIQDSSVANLSVITNGSSTPSPAELLESPRLGILLAELSQQFDLVLIDAPPLLAVADPAIIAPLVDAVVLTVRVSKNGRRPVEHAAKILENLNTVPAAVVVNGVDEDTKSYGYGNYTQDGYGYVGHYHDRYSASPAQPTDDRAQPSDKHEKSRFVPAPTNIPQTSFASDSTNSSTYS